MACFMFDFRSFSLPALLLFVLSVSVDRRSAFAPSPPQFRLNVRFLRAAFNSGVDPRDPIIPCLPPSAADAEADLFDFINLPDADQLPKVPSRTFFLSPSLSQSDRRLLAGDSDKGMVDGIYIYIYIYICIHITVSAVYRRALSLSPSRSHLPLVAAAPTEARAVQCHRLSGCPWPVRCHWDCAGAWVPKVARH